LAGFEHALLNQTEVGAADYRWFKQYGSLFRNTGCFGEEVVMVSDPLGLHHILHTSGYHYPRAKDNRHMFRTLLGRGILWAEGDVHYRQRKALNPAFSWSQTKALLATFQRAAARLTLQWSLQIETEEIIIDLYSWFSKATLDIIGESAFDFEFGAVEGSPHELTHILENLLFVFSFIFPSKYVVLIRAFRRRFPSLSAVYSAHFPTKEEKRFSHFQEVAKKTARALLEKNQAESRFQGNKDVLDILAEANNAEDPKRRMDEDEILCQMATVVLGGHDTTASSLSFLIWELAKHPKDQEKVFQEIQHVRATKGGVLTPSEYDSMPYFNAVIKEGLRLHPASPNLPRYTEHDDVIPLAYSIISKAGKVLDQVPVPKGTRVIVAIGAYNRLPSLWGSDADEWNPSRFLHMKRDTDFGLGLYANLLSFSAGVRSCIGWRFALLETQAILFEILKQYEFSIPPAVNIHRVMGAIMVPFVQGREDEGPKMPLILKRRASN
ncbi:hypothetical protein GYMLUDRAFT_168094, partial [Collybiopsis luxurians FD-317 M1]